MRRAGLVAGCLLATPLVVLAGALFGAGLAALGMARVLVDLVAGR